MWVWGQGGCGSSDSGLGRPDIVFISTSTPIYRPISPPGNLFPIGGRHAESQKAGVFRAGSRLKDLTALEEMPLVPFVEIR